jgi:mannose-1-phosphate guanylyltransferase
MRTKPAKRMATAVEDGDLWVVLLAAGDGTRVHGLVRDGRGVLAPKQFCTLDGTESMLRWSVRRALGVVPMDRIVPVVAAKHRYWWTKDLSDLPSENVVIQPRNRGTAIGILLPLLHILEQDRHARVLILPSDHHATDEERLRKFIIRAVSSLEMRSDRIVLLGMVPEGPDSDYGWIVPVSTGEWTQVEAFVEKPDRDEARSLMRRGALLNSFIIAAEAEVLLQLYLRTLPDLVGEFGGWKNEAEGRWSALTALYDVLPSLDFSREVLERSPGYLSTVCVSGCGWTDLGTPARLHDYATHRNRASALQDHQPTA